MGEEGGGLIIKTTNIIYTLYLRMTVPHTVHTIISMHTTPVIHAAAAAALRPYGTHNRTDIHV